MKKAYFRKFGNFDCIKLNHIKYTKTIIIKLSVIFTRPQVRPIHNIINIGEKSKYIKEFMLVLKK